MLVLKDGVGCMEKSLKSMESFSPSTDAQARKSAAKEADDEQSAGAMVVAAEDIATGRVSYDTFLAYLKAGGGKVRGVGILTLYVCTQVLRIMCDWWVGKWTEDGLSLSGDTYAVCYLIGVLIFGLFVFSRGLILTFTMLRASTNLHNAMFEKVLGAPMGWWWTQPSARVLNRFSRDQDNIDRLLVKSMQDFMNFFYRVWRACRND